MGELWEPGPWPVWNTHPGLGCNENPTIPEGPHRTIVAVTGAEADLVYPNVQMYVTYPADSDPSVTGQADVAAERFGVLVFAHANNDRVCQIFESYYGLHDHWASWGWVVVSVDQTPFNCDAGNRTNVIMRQRGVEAALDHLRVLDADPASRFYQRLDLDRVVLAGHSRGGGAVSLAAQGRDDVLGVILLQTIDLEAFGFSNHSPNVPVLGITAGNDVDLHYPRVEPTEDRLSAPYTWVNINGGAHALTADSIPLEWDDRPGISRKNQHDLTKLYTTAFLRHVAGEDDGQDVLFTLEGNRLARALSGSGAYQRWQTGAESLWIDRFDRDDPTRNDVDGEVTSQGFLRADEVYTYRPNAVDPPSPRWRGATSLFLSSAASAVYETTVREAASFETVSFRAKSPDFGALAPLGVGFVSDDGEVLVRIDEQHRGPLRLSNRFQQVVVPVPEGTNLRAIQLRTVGGSIFVDDLRLTR